MALLLWLVRSLPAPLDRIQLYLGPPEQIVDWAYDRIHPKPRGFFDIATRIHFSINMYMLHLITCELLVGLGFMWIASTIRKARHSRGHTHPLANASDASKVGTMGNNS